jgi:MFS family permease
MADSYGVASVGATMLSLCMISNTGGKILLGALVDRLGARLSILSFSGLIFVSLLMLLFVHNGAALAIAALLFGLCYSLATVGISLTTREVFGPQNYTRVYPTFSLGGNVANAVFSSVVGFLYDFSQGYSLTLWMMLGMVVVTALLILRAFQGGKAAA